MKKLRFPYQILLFCKNPTFCIRQSTKNSLYTSRNSLFLIPKELKNIKVNKIFFERERVKVFFVKFQKRLNWFPRNNSCVGLCYCCATEECLNILSVWTVVVSARRHVMRHRKICLLIREYSNAKTPFAILSLWREEEGNRKWDRRRERERKSCFRRRVMQSPAFPSTYLTCMMGIHMGNGTQCLFLGRK